MQNALAVRRNELLKAGIPEQMALVLILFWSYMLFWWIRKERASSGETDMCTVLRQAFMVDGENHRPLFQLVKTFKNIITRGDNSELLRGIKTAE